MNTLAPELRMMALGLPIPPPIKNKGGRPRTPLMRGVRVAQRWYEAINARVEAIALKKLGVVQERKLRQAQKIRRLLAEGASPHKIAAAKVALDRMGRISSAPIEPPSVGLRAKVDREIAKEFRIGARTVRRHRSDKDLQCLCPSPVWKPSEVVREGRWLWVRRRLIDALIALMPEVRQAKRERVEVILGSARVLKVLPSIEIIPGSPEWPGTRCGFIGPIPKSRVWRIGKSWSRMEQKYHQPDWPDSEVDLCKHAPARGRFEPHPPLIFKRQRFLAKSEG